MKTVTYIDTPEEWKITNDWNSHRPLLWLASCNVTDKPITEFGCGFGSTILLRHRCNQQKRPFLSYETNRNWADKFTLVTKMNDYDEIHLSEEPFRQGILFIDLAPADVRKTMIEKHANHADVIIVHDSEKSSQFCYYLEPTLSKFKYRLNFEPEKYPHTTVVSNFVDVEAWV